ncbi:putative leukotriene A-4 hydrolase (LTA-4 hydrolase) (Leukotriene A(4) hydrolase) [Phytophthora pseudosyringae]|uniref:Putative leukotriene A-4 hydrolase (LTA-4 hydrolase) (Leukotriene A(4) hydrolase) n=1 Tax=Phytophthora pseudosyringae TaxID=221518 RepID=A0A8T1W707_9STRA|nr:putative leukotriene A-4 hydrolase (LTA-4 hydrolase) (Leukotriene A(4) hydrolase) [Phytophthora pseudosyringae]
MATPAAAAPAALSLRSQSFANLDEVLYRHLQWTLAIDFERRQLQGFAEYTFAYTGTAKCPVLILDTQFLMIASVSVDGVNVDSFHLTDQHSVFGRALSVPISSLSTTVRVSYTTSAQSSGLQWLSPLLTAGKEHPFLFTQCQAIHARSVVPCPDTPAAKFTYSATVTVPQWCTVLMSAIAHGYVKNSDREQTKKWTFRQDVPIPSYLLAIAAGEMESVELSSRSRVWAEPRVVTRAAHEFAQTEAFLKAAEEITGQEYLWKRYDLVCLPPSFPYGGMENPCLTFVTPTLLAGDRSLADVVAHEIAHSWTGNLVTNATWSDFWLNEGWTVWLERKIVAKIHNDPKTYDLKAALGMRGLVEAIQAFGASHPYTALVPNSEGVDPDDVFSRVPYEKGFNFLHYLSTVVGSDEFDSFAQAYIQKFKFQTVTSQDFRTFFEKHFAAQPAWLSQIDWEGWFFSTGMPLIENKFDTSMISQVRALGEKMTTTSDDKKWAEVMEPRTLRKWPASLWILLLDTLLLLQTSSQVRLTATHMDAIDAFAHNHLSTTHNSELRFRWFTLSLRSCNLRVLDRTVDFLKEQGRMKFVRPLFRDLCVTLGVVRGAAIFEDCKSRYHPIAAKMIQRDIESMQASKKHVRAMCTNDFNGIFAHWLGLPLEYAGYSPLLVLLGGLAVATAVALSKRR